MLKRGKVSLQATLDSSLYVIQAFKAVRNKSGKIVDFVWVMSNKKAIEQNGDLIGKSLLQQNPGVVKSGLLKQFIQVTETGLEVDQEVYYNHEQFNGWFHQTLVKMDDGFVMHTEDITEKKKNQQEILHLKDEMAQRVEDKYQVLFSSIDEGFCVVELEVDEKDNIRNIYFREVNRAFEKQSGFSNAVGKSVKELLPRFEKYWIDVFTEVMRTGQSVRAENYVQDVGRWYTAYFSLVGNVGSKYIAVIFNDVTERKKAEEALQKVAKQKDEFIGIASHELKTPVTSIKTFTEVLESRFSKKGDKTSAQLLGKMKGQIDKLANLINDLLDVTKIESGRMQLDEEIFNFDTLVTETVEEVQRTVEKHIIFRQGKTNKKFLGDREKIEQVITNLLINAIKYSPKATKIILKVSANTQEILFSVQDFGIGIEAAKQQKIFERFYRENGAKERTFPGLGIGLYVASEIIKKHGGKIWVESKKGKGSNFSFSLPLKKSENV